MKVLFIETWLHNPHIETAFEIAQSHLDCGDQVFFYFAGHDLAWKDGMTTGHQNLFRTDPDNLPERRLRGLFRNRNFIFKKRAKVLPRLSYSDSIPVTEDQLVKIRYKESAIGLAALSSLIHELKWSKPDLKLYSKEIQLMLSSGMQSFDLATRLIQKHLPDLVYVFNGRFVNTRSIMEAAIATNTPYKIHERGCNMYHYSVRPFMPHDFEKLQNELIEHWYKVFNENPECARDIAHNFFKSRRQGKQQAWFSMTKDQDKGCLPEINTEKKIVTYFTSSDDEYKAVGDIVKWNRWKDQDHCLRDIVDICTSDNRLQLIVRIHPHMQSKHPSDLQAILSICKNYPGIILIYPDSPVDSYALIDSSDVVVTSMSTIGIESVYWGTPSICMGPSYYSNLNAVMLPQDKAQLQTLLRETTRPNVDPSRALPFGYYMNTFGQKFKYYQPTALQYGAYMGIDVQSPPPQKIHKKILARVNAKGISIARKAKSIAFSKRRFG